MKTMGARIYQKRVENHFTQEEVGNVLGVQKSTVGKWEHGETQAIKRSYIAKMAEMFHCSPAWLYGMEDAPEVTLTYEAPNKEPVKVIVDNHRPVIGESAKRVLLYEAALAIPNENLDIAIELLKSLAKKE